MAPDTSGIVNLEDGSHPNLNLSKLNNEAPFFKLLSKDIRLMIYKLAVREENPIKPQQVKAHSNKFVWGGYELDANKEKKPTGQQLTTVSLSHTCRAIYSELEGWCPFYRVNEFQFDQDALELLAFLSAIAPQRRRNIRYINIHLLTPGFAYRSFDGMWWPTRDSLWRIKQERRVSKHIYALLGQCDELKKHELSVTYDFRQVETEQTVFALLKCLAWAREPLDEKYVRVVHVRRLRRSEAPNSMWSLPFFTPRFIVGETVNIRRQRTGLNGPQWFDDMANNHGFYVDAVAAAHIHFPGDRRIPCDIMNSSGPVSTRTRSMRRLPNSAGIAGHPTSLYNAEGILKEPEIVKAKEGLSIVGIRWGGEDVQCRFVSKYPGVLPADPWVNLNALRAPQYEKRIRHYYNEKVLSYTEIYQQLGTTAANVVPAQIAALYQVARAIPTPAETLKAAGGIEMFYTDRMYSLRHKNGPNNGYQRRWAILERKWQNYLSRLYTVWYCSV
ncbi:uncharacterized protein F4822DRAFT_441230 [Hypoxylon trugodes]|uniref:uncharacterized protein n=1 Tax=Hypoxylon trugodes TaxID=326681 RepID=UPI0021A094E0|nr:uncharacterized protein F4822DRAFT_441230 [Hypoxylon trugodes]KAI1392156.1 hypothetical protein F4822DRAFT_441230 [Hypoxylon trugodes]